jgi:hypothetical protein
MRKIYFEMIEINSLYDLSTKQTARAWDKRDRAYYVKTGENF